MKKTSILGLCLLTAAAASAQITVVKEAEKAMKSGKPFTEVVTIVTPAFSDPATAQLAQTYYVPGKAGFKQYDDVLGKRQIGIIKDGDPQITAAVNALLGGYDYFMKALPLDSLPNEKGQIKPKYSKDMLSTIQGHQNDFNTAAVDFWAAKEYDNAYKSWDIFLNFQKNPMFPKAQQYPDSTLSDIAYNQGLAAWQANNYDAALNSFRKSMALGNDKKQLFEYAVAVANNAKNNEAILEFAEAGNRLYGHDDPQFINHIINYYLNTEKYDEAINILNNAISADPSNAQYYALEGIIYDNQKNRTKSLECYDKALSLNPDNAVALFYKGRALAAQAGELSDNYNGNGYDAYKASTLAPLYRQSVELLEKAYQLDPNNRHQILQVLEIDYYNLNDQVGMDSVKERKLDD